MKLSEDEIEVFAEAKYSKFDENEIKVNLDLSSFEFDSKKKIQYNSFYSIRIKGLIKIINKKNYFTKHHE